MTDMAGHGNTLLSFWARVPVSANQILPHLFAGNYSSAESEEFLRENKIGFVLNMTKDKHSSPVEGVEYLNLSLDDLATEDISVHFEAAHEFIERARLAKSRVLVHCHMGISRACTISMAHMMQLNGDGELQRRTLKAAFAHVRRQREVAFPNHGFFGQLQAFEMKLSGSDKPTMSFDDLREASYH